MLRPSSLKAGFAVALVFALAFAAPTLAGDAWSSFRGPRGTGESLEGLPPGDGPLSMELAWKQPLGNGYSGISIADGRVVTAYTDGEKDLLVAIDATSGEQIWQREIGPHYPGHDGAHNGPVTTPAIADGRIFMLDPAGSLAAFDLASGDQIWSTHLVDDHGSEKPTYGFSGSPLVVGETMILIIGGEAGVVGGFDTATGELRWRAVEDGIGYGSQSPVLTNIAGRDQVLVLTHKKLSGIDPSDGTVLWDFDHEGRDSGMGSWTSSPLPLGGNRIFLKVDDPDSAVIEVAEVDGAMGVLRLASSKGMVRSYSPATLAGDHVYGYTARFLSAVDPRSGEMLWRTRAVGDGFVISIADHLAIIQKTGSLHLGQASPEGWTEASSIELFDDLAWTPPSYEAGAIYVRSQGEIARIDVTRSAPTMLADVTLPASMAALATQVAEASDAAVVVDEFLADRELPLIDGEEVVFIWRGEAEDVAVAGDMIGMRREEKMTRMEGTDLWWWATEIDPHARLNYLFYPDYAPTVDPSHDRVVAATILGPDMNWNRGVDFQMSWFAMPEWPGLDIEAVEPTARGRIEEIELTVQPTAPEGEETPEPATVATTVWLPPGYDDSDTSYPVVYLYNDEALEAGDWPSTLDRVVGTNVEPLIVVSTEFPQVPGLRGSLAGQIVPQIDETFRTRPDRESRALVGMGFPGFSTMMSGFSASDTFGALGIQSIFFLEGGMKEGMQGAVGDKTPETTPMRIYLEWGRWDLISPHEGMNFRESSKWAWDFLNEKGYEVMGGEMWDSTDHSSWSNRTGVMLQSLFPIEGAESDLHLWQTGAR